MSLQTFAADENVNQSVVNQVILPAERTKLTVKNRRLAATLGRLISLNPIGLAANFVEPLVCYLGEAQNGLELASQRGWTRHQARLRKPVRKRPFIWSVGHDAKWSNIIIRLHCVQAVVA